MGGTLSYALALSPESMIRPDLAHSRSPEVPRATKGLCRWCGKPVPKGRVSWCSQRCVDERWALDPGHIRRYTEARDRGVCATCGRDCLALERRISEWRSGLKRLDTARRHNLARFERLLIRLAVPRPPDSLWQADHIVPLVEGGWNLMSNIRTLCLCCHKAETKALAGRRKVARQAAGPQLSLDGVLNAANQPQIDTH